jgi:hypothetical protein
MNGAQVTQSAGRKCRLDRRPDRLNLAINGDGKATFWHDTAAMWRCG